MEAEINEIITFNNCDFLQWSISALFCTEYIFVCKLDNCPVYLVGAGYRVRYYSRPQVPHCTADTQMDNPSLLALQGTTCFSSQAIVISSDNPYPIVSFVE